MTSFIRHTLLALSASTLLAACGAGNGDAPADHDTPPTRTAALAGTSDGSTTNTNTTQSMTYYGATSTAALSGAGMTRAQAAKFLGYASFGPTSASIDQLVSTGQVAWINNQFTLAQTLHRSYFDQIKTLTGGSEGTPNQFYESFWKQAANGNDQLRQRVTYALSQIFVVSYQDANLFHYSRGVASYYDMLGSNAFGNFRDLLLGVATHPMMGVYLSHLRNQRQDGTRMPDENFAREVMQLFSIGLYQLNPDGSRKLVNGLPVETYSHRDVLGMAQVFTGWSWAGPDKTRERFLGWVSDPDKDWKQMQMYQAYHSLSPKTFLGVTLPGSQSGERDTFSAIDTLFRHPNVGPFIGRQLIQRLVTSNPSPAYVARVAAKFDNNGWGTRGDMRAVISAILLDPEALGAPSAGGTRQKVREPVLRLANWVRAFNAQSASGRYQIGNLEDPLSGIAQTPMRAPSVFNFYRPGYTPPNSAIAAAGEVAPEMQIVGAPSVIGYVNSIRGIIALGAGVNNDVRSSYVNELALAATPDLLVDRVNLLLLNGAMSDALRKQILAALNAGNTQALTEPNTALGLQAKKNRVWLAIYLTMISPDYIVQK